MRVSIEPGLSDNARSTICLARSLGASWLTAPRVSILFKRPLYLDGLTPAEHSSTSVSSRRLRLSSVVREVVAPNMIWIFLREPRTGTTVKP